MASSPSPSVDSINSGDLGDAVHLSEQSTEGQTDQVNWSISSSSGLGPSPSDSIFSSSTKCPACTQTFTNPKVLQCFHVFCQPCLSKCFDGGDVVSCPQCQTETSVGPRGLEGLITDFSSVHLIESASSWNGDHQLGYCSGCQNGEAVPVAKCLNCESTLCSSCVIAHQFKHCFEGHNVVTLGEMACKDTGRHDIHELDVLCKFIQDGRSKAQEVQTNLKSFDAIQNRHSMLYDCLRNDIEKTFGIFTATLEERKSELLREAKHIYNERQMALSSYNQKAQEVMGKLMVVTDFIERMMRNASNSEVLQFKRLFEQRIILLLTNYPELRSEDVADFSLAFNHQAIQNSAKTAFGFIRMDPSELASSLVTSGGQKQPPISRPAAGVGPGVLKSLRSVPVCGSANALGTGFPSGPSLDQSASGPSYQSNVGPSFLPRQHYTGMQSPLPGLCAGNFIGQGTNQELDDQFITTRFGCQNTSFGPLLVETAHTSRMTGNPLDKWAPCSGEKMYFNMSGQEMQGQYGFTNSSSLSGTHLNSTADSILDISAKLLNQSIFPPKSQIKRHKMIYHCKFGEFGVLEGQFTEPSGVAVNAQNDVIVADTNNHRIQIFDKEGRFKFQFGECGKRDGQLLYPNRVAVIKNSGDIIVTERSPTHQVQIYNQYGQFVRKFGANILQHPRGVCVDNRGRIIVVECKVMRVIIFDQLGNVLTKFGCSKHLEFPNGVVVNDRQEIFISDNRAHCVKVFNYDGVFLRQIGGEGITNYPIGVGINSVGEIAIADNHNNFNLTVFSQDGQLLSALESKVKHAQCFDVALMDDGSVVLASKDYRLYVYRYAQIQIPI